MSANVRGLISAGQVLLREGKPLPARVPLTLRSVARSAARCIGYAMVGGTIVGGVSTGMTAATQGFWGPRLVSGEGAASLQSAAQIANKPASTFPAANTKEAKHLIDRYQKNSAIFSFQVVQELAGAAKTQSAVRQLLRQAATRQATGDDQYATDLIKAENLVQQWATQPQIVSLIQRKAKDEKATTLFVLFECGALGAIVGGGVSLCRPSRRPSQSPYSADDVSEIT